MVHRSAQRALYGVAERVAQEGSAQLYLAWLYRRQANPELLGPLSRCLQHIKVEVKSYGTSSKHLAYEHKVPEYKSDPTGIWQYEVNNELILGKTKTIRKQLHFMVAETIRKSLAPYSPPATSPETELAQERFKTIVETTVALALAADGVELRQILQLAPALAPFPSVIGSTELGDAAAAVHHESLLAPPGVLGTLASIVQMHPGPGLDAFMEYLHHRTQEASLMHWMSMVGRLPPLESGEVIDFSAPPRAARPHDLDAAQRQLFEDMICALRANFRLMPYMEHEALKAAVIPAALLSPLDSPEVTMEQRKVVRASHERWLEANEKWLIHGLQKLPEDTMQVLWSLRSGRRRWRLDLADWQALALALVRGASPHAQVSKQATDAVTGGAEGVRRVALGALLRGQFLAAVPGARRNTHALRAVTEAAHALPGNDVQLLLDKWKTLKGPVAHRALMRVLRFGELNPSISAPSKDGNAIKRGSVQATRRFVRAMLTQVLLEALPASWTAWKDRLYEGIDELPGDRLQVLADALALPHALTSATTSHVVLQLVAPERLLAQDVFAYLEKTHKVWGDMGLDVEPLDEHMIRNLVPRVVDRLCNHHNGPASDTLQYIKPDTLKEIAVVLGGLDTAALLNLTTNLHRLTTQEVQEIMTAALEATLQRVGSTRQELMDSLSESDDSARQLDEQSFEERKEEEMVDQRLAHIESFRPASWLPPEILPVDHNDPRTWRKEFHNVVYATAGVLMDDLLECDEEDWAKARLLFMLAQEVGLPIAKFSNAPAVVDFILNHIPSDGVDAFLGPPDSGTLYSPMLDVTTAQEGMLPAGCTSEDLVKVNLPPAVAEFNHNPDAYGMYPAMLELVNEAVRACPASARELLGDAVSAPVATVEGLSANAVAQLIIKSEAKKIVSAGGLLEPAIAALRWGWEHTPRNVPLTLVSYWGDPWNSQNTPLEIVNACARLARADEGIRQACSVMDFPQKLELAHVTAARRLQEQGVLGECYMPAEERVALIMRDLRRDLKEFEGDAETAALETKASVGRYLDELPTAEDAIDYHMSTSRTQTADVACGVDMVELRLRRQLENEAEPEMARMDRTGAVTSKLAIAGDALLMPDLIQNIADRPVSEVMEFFTQLDSLPAKPDIESLRTVFKWYDDGFLPGVNYEENPLEAWRQFEREYLVNAEMVTIRQRNKSDSQSSEIIETRAQITPVVPDLREILAQTSLEDQAQGVPMKSRGDAQSSSQPADEDSPVATPATVFRTADVDAKGRAHASGRRKESSARVWLSHGVGDVTVNKLPLGKYFGNVRQRASVLSPLVALGSPGNWAVDALVEGGGPKGQAEAIQLAVARAMVKLEPETHRKLKDLGLLTRDPRVVECKKPAQKKARKKRQWVKR